MATIKSHTDIEQSRKLAEILPLESADMYYAYYHNPISGASYYEEYPIFHMPMNKNKSLPCWSLATLLSVLPKLHKLQHSEEGYYCSLANYKYITEAYNNPIDACVAMIEKLHELKML